MIGVLRVKVVRDGGCTKKIGVHFGTLNMTIPSGGIRNFKLVSYQNPPPPTTHRINSD